MTHPISQHDFELWRDCVEAVSSSIRFRQELFASSKPCLGALIATAQQTPGQTMAALEVAAIHESAGLPGDSRPSTASDLEAWDRFVASQAVAVRARDKFLSEATDRVGVVRQGLESTGAGRGVALDVASRLEVAEREQVADLLLAMASYSHGQTIRARQVLLTLPKPWLLANIERLAEPILKEGTDEEYRAIFEVDRAISPDLARRLVDRAIAHHDEEIRHAGAELRDEISPT